MIEIANEIKIINNQPTLFQNYHKDLIKKCSHDLFEQLQKELNELLQDAN